MEFEQYLTPAEKEHHVAQLTVYSTLGSTVAYGTHHITFPTGLFPVVTLELYEIVSAFEHGKLGIVEEHGVY